MIVGLAALLALPAGAGPELSPGTDEPAPRVSSIGRLHNSLGLVAGVGLTSRRHGEPAGALGRLARSLRDEQRRLRKEAS